MMRRTIVLGTVVALFCSMLLGGLGFAATSEEIEERALEAMRAGHYTKAAGLWQQVLEIHPGQPGALYNLACCYSRAGELDQAALRLEEAFNGGLRDPELLKSDPDLEALRETRTGRALIDRLVSEARNRGVPGYFEAPVLGGIRVVVPHAMKKDQMYPLVMVLHGHGGNPEPYVGMFERAGSSLDAIVSAPYGPYPIPFEKGHGYSWYPAPWFFQEVLRAGTSTGDLAQRRKKIDLQEQVVSRSFVLAAIDHVCGELADRSRSGLSHGTLRGRRVGLWSGSRTPGSVSRPDRCRGKAARVRHHGGNPHQGIGTTRRHDLPFSVPMKPSVSIMPERPPKY